MYWLFFSIYITSKTYNKINVCGCKFINIKNKSCPLYMTNSFVEKGIASYYSNKFNGRKTSNGDCFLNKYPFSAHKKLPLPSFIMIIYVKNNTIRGILSLVNDRGPFHNKRILDVSKKIAHEIGFLKKGTHRVVIVYLPKNTISLRNNKKFIYKIKCSKHEKFSKNLREITQIFLQHFFYGYFTITDLVNIYIKIIFFLY